ncbi:ankycorbin isoform X1 [Pyxicephalus adspersus]|uniref:ankycorbin isoform X1 n=1 Tax=Pyxicephalus adspersus TaxID=30357 RepID=UPI003B5B9376
MKSLKAKFRKSDTNEWNKNDERLLQAVDHGETDKVSALLGKKGVLATKLDSEGKTAFHVAATKGNADCLKVMLTHGADVSAQDLSGHTALHLSVKNNHIECVKRLLQSKCPTECTDSSGRTCVHYAASNGNVPMLQLLCENKCLLNAKDSDGKTPLLIAVQCGHLEACKCLLDHKADVNITDKNGKSPLMLACEAGQSNMVDLLVHRGANLTLADTLGHDVLHYARTSGNPHILTLLLSKTSQDSGLRSPTKPLQHDQANRLSSDRSGTPKKRKAPPPPISPVQLSDMSSPISSTSTPLSAKGEVFFPEKGSKDDNTSYRRDIRDRLSDSTGEDSLFDVSSEAEHQDTLSLLQAKVATLTLLNKELQDKLQEKANAEAITDISCDSFHSTQAELSIAKDTKSPAVISDTSDISIESQPEVTKYELKVKHLEQTIEEMQMKLQESETIRKDLETHIQSISAGCHASFSTETSETPSDSDLQPQGSINERKDDTALKPNLQRMSNIDQDYEEGIAKLNDDNALVLEEFEALKRKYQEVLGESERKENEMNDLRHQIDAVTQSIVNLVPIERQEEMEKSYCAVIEKLNMENAELNKRQEELVEEIKSLRKELERHKEPMPLENGHEEEDKSTMIDELTKQISELSLLYNEAQTELEKTRQASNHISAEYIHKDEHVKLMQQIEESKEKVENDLVDLASQHARILEELCELKQQFDKEKEGTPGSEFEKVIDDLKKQIENMKVEKSELMEQLASQESRMKTLEDELHQEKVTVQESAVTKRLLAERQVSLEEEISALSSKIGELLREKDRFAADNGHAQKDIAQLKEEKERLEGQLKLKEQEVDELYMKYEKVQEDLVEMKKVSENSSKVDEDKDKKINELTKEVSKLKEALNSLSQLSFTTSTPKRQTQQLEALQQQVKQLQNQLVETKKQHQEIVSVYRMHLLYAVQGQMDEDVQKVLKQILTMCKSQSQKM